MRLLIILTLIYLVYRAIKSWVAGSAGASGYTRKFGTPMAQDEGAGRKEIDDVLVKDPNCNVYFPRENGVTVLFQEEKLHFCSPECRDEYLVHHDSSTNDT